MKRLSFWLLLMAITTVSAWPSGTPFRAGEVSSPAAGKSEPFHINEITYNPEKNLTRFSLVTLGDAQGVILRLYHDGLTGPCFKKKNMRRKDTFTSKHLALWDLEFKGNLEGVFYTFDVKYGKKRWGETPGIFPLAVGVNGKRAAVVDLRKTDPEGWEQDHRPHIEAKDLIIYELHHRDFSIARNINLDPSVTVKRMASEFPGKYLALTEGWAIGHLQSLGVNAVHLLPSFDFASIDETRLDEPQYNWGYDPVNYTVPEGCYSTDPTDPTRRIVEFKRMVQALHNAGIKVILDVVFNHTYDVDGSSFQRTMPDYFYRKNLDGSYSNGSGCGNETASERPLMRQFMIDCCKYWVDEYHIDGFRFDLMGIHDIATMNAIREALPNDIFIYGEGWAAGNCALPYEQLGMKAHMSRMPGIAAFSDELRDALRGPWDSDEKAAFLGGVIGNEESIKFGIAGGVPHPQVDYTKVNYADHAWASEPTQMISYVSCHDDMCLADRLRASIPGISTGELIRLDLLAQTAVMTSQGVPFMLCGEEMLRDKKGVHNSYNSPDSVNQLDWSRTFSYSTVTNYYRRLIALRKRHPAFHLGTADAVRRHLEFLPTQDCLVAFKLTGHAGGDEWQDIYVALNANSTPRFIEVPEGSYTIVCQGDAIDENGLGTVQGGTVSVPAQSALIIHN